MKTVITAKLKLKTTSAQFQALRDTQLAYRNGLNYVSQYAFAHNKMSNKVALQDGTYAELRTRFHLPSQMACSIPRQVGASYKTLWTKVKQNAQQRQAGRTKKRYKGSRTYQTEERQEGQREATQSECAPVEVVLCGVARPDCI